MTGRGDPTGPCRHNGCMARIIGPTRALALCLFATFAAPADTLASPFGEWARSDGNAHVRIERCGAALCAINTWIKDTSNGEEAGHRLIMDVKPDGPYQFSGRAYDPQRERSYSISIRVSGRRMTTRGCVFGVLCKSETWTRLQ